MDLNFYVMLEEIVIELFEFFRLKITEDRQDYLEFFVLFGILEFQKEILGVILV